MFQITIWVFLELKVYEIKNYVHPIILCHNQIKSNRRFFEENQLKRCKFAIVFSNRTGPTDQPVLKAQGFPTCQLK